MQYNSEYLRTEINVFYFFILIGENNPQNNLHQTRTNIKKDETSQKRV